MDQNPDPQQSQAAQQDWLRQQPPRPAERRRSLLTSAALVAGGLVLGGATVATVQAVADDGQPTTAFPGPGGMAGGMPGGTPGMAGGPAGGTTGGVAGEEHLEGTLTDVTARSVTVRTSSGTDAYTLTDTTEIVRDGAAATVDDLQAGDPVLVHVYPSTSGDGQLVERIFAGTMPVPGAAALPAA